MSINNTNDTSNRILTQQLPQKRVFPYENDANITVNTIDNTYINGSNHKIDDNHDNQSLLDIKRQRII